jgi:hypothetical protein
MDSWTAQQLDIMKAGGNNNCNSFLLERGGIASTTPIRQKYDNPTANHYKEVLRARMEGKPEPPMIQSSITTNQASKASSSQVMGKMKDEDPNGRERLSGESDDQYITRQTRLRDEARARLAAKGLGSSMSSHGGGGQSRTVMQGIGSDSSYDPNRGGYSNSSSLYQGLSSAASSVDIANVTGTIACGLGSAWSSIGNVANSVIKDDKNIVGSLSGTVLSTGAGLWSTFSNAAQGIAKNLTAPDRDNNADDEDGLVQLQEMMRAAKTNNSKYVGFGSDSFQTVDSNPTITRSSSSTVSSSHVFEERDSSKVDSSKTLEPLEGESNDQYMARQSRIFHDAKVRVEARFENPVYDGMSLAKNSTLTRDGASSGSINSSGSHVSSKASAALPKPPATRMKMDSSDDFFSSFGA